MARICHVTSAHNVEDVRIFEKECVSLAKRCDYEVYIAGPGTGEYVSKNVRMVGCGERPQSRTERMLKYAGNVVDKALELDADIYHIHDPELLRYAFKLKTAGKKVVFDSHENVLDSIEEKRYIPKPFRKLVKSYYSRIQRRILPKLDAVVVVSPQMVPDMERFNENVYLIGNYPIIKDTPNKTCGKCIRGRIIFAGGISEQWSHREIIEAIENIEGVEYHLFGSGSQGYLDELKSLPGWKKTVYHGRVDFDLVQNELENAHFCMALLKPGRNTFGTEGTLGNTKLFEAMEKGKPIIATNFTLWKDIVEKKGCGLLVNPGDKEEIISAIKSIMSMDEVELKSMGDRGRKAVKEKYNWRNCEEVLYGMYDKLIQGEIS